MTPEMVLKAWTDDQCRGMRVVWEVHRDLFPMTFADFLKYISEKVAGVATSPTSTVMDDFHEQLDRSMQHQKQNLQWGTYGKGGAEHCAGRCPLHQLTWKKLIDCDTDHLQAILRTQHHIPLLYSVVIGSILEDRGVVAEKFDLAASNEFYRKVTAAMQLDFKEKKDMDSQAPAVDTAVSTSPAAVDTRDMIFVFGSNEEGAHGGGAARVARTKHGAIWGQAEGLQGSSYGLPTCHKPVGQPGWQIPFASVHQYVENFLKFATDNPQLEFQVTQVGCGLAGWTIDQIAPLFLGAPSNCYFDTAWENHLPGAKFWGHA